MNAKTYFLVCCLLISAETLIAQTPVFDWVKTAGAGNIDRGFEVAVDPLTGDVYTSGSFTNTVDFDPGPGVANLTAPGASNDDQIYLAKFNSAGDFLWAKGIGGADSDFPQSMVMDQNTHEIYIAGRFRGPSDFDPGAGVFNLTSVGTFYDLFVAKYDSAGNFIWAKALQGRVGHAFGIALDGLGSVIVSGDFTGTQQDFDPGAGTAYLVSNGAEDIFICKLTTAGNFVWAKSFGAGNSEYGDGLLTDSNGNIFLSGKFQGTVDFDPGANTFTMNCLQDDAFLAKFDASGNFVFAKQIGGTGLSRGYSLVSDASQNIFIAGMFTDTTDFDPGTPVFNVVSSGQQDIFILKLDATGNFIWVKTTGSTGTEIPAAIKLDAAENIYLTGYFFGATDLDPGPGVVGYTSVGFTDGFILVLSPQGNYLWDAVLAGPDYANPSDLDLDNMGNIYSIGSYSGTVDFDPAAPVVNMTSAGGDDIYFHKLTPFTNGVPELQNRNEILAYPNPSNKIISMNNLTPGSRIDITDLAGKVVYSTIAIAANITMNLEHLNKGVYFLIVFNESKKATSGKIVIH